MSAADLAGTPRTWSAGSTWNTGAAWRAPKLPRVLQGGVHRGRHGPAVWGRTILTGRRSCDLRRRSMGVCLRLTPSERTAPARASCRKAHDEGPPGTLAQHRGGCSGSARHRAGVPDLAMSRAEAWPAPPALPAVTGGWEASRGARSKAAKRTVGTGVSPQDGETLCAAAGGANWGRQLRAEAVLVPRGTRFPRSLKRHGTVEAR